MNFNKYVVIKDILITEYPYLTENVYKGEIVYHYHGNTYGCISPKGKAFSRAYGETPFFELPNNSVERIEL